MPEPIDLFLGTWAVVFIGLVFFWHWREERAARRRRSERRSKYTVWR